MGIPIAAEESDLNVIDSAFKLLTSRDDRLRKLAVAHRSHTVRPRVKRTPTDQDLSDYLSGEMRVRTRLLPTNTPTLGLSTAVRQGALTSSGVLRTMCQDFFSKT
ncbi:hypothetical protein CEXT_569961 [Caerostris extrusa]|uniref:Uncharacterized protein n=1 Tax=Caerostris extrusa TaxID=172846 RepID=A0AAV4XJU6_CAEEX|nr:hypothetical protein CEXT_569961 [Caerostris extrusa]